MDKDSRRSMFRNYLRSSLPDGVTDLANARQIPVAHLSPNPFQPRSEEGFEAAALDELATSIRAHGVLQPLLVRQTPGEEDLYQIAAGERRWRAARIADLETVPCVVRDLNDRQLRELALIENVFREDLSPVDLGRALQQMMEMFELSARALSERLGKNHSYVDDKLKIVRDPRIAAAVKIGTLGPTVALELAELVDEEARTTLLTRVERGERVKVKDVHAAALERRMPVKPAVDPLLNAPPHDIEGQDDMVDVPVKPARPADSGHVDRQDGHDHVNRHGPPPATASPLVPTLPVKPAIAPQSVTSESPGTVADNVLVATDPAQVSLRDLRIIQLREGRDGEPRQLAAADPITVLRILEADLAWLKDKIQWGHGASDG